MNESSSPPQLDVRGERIVRSPGPSAAPLRNWCERIARAALALIPEAAVVRVPFGPMRGMRWMPVSTPHGAWLGRLERRQLEAFVSRIPRGAVVWDVGANVGLYTVPAARAAGPSGCIVAFEPVPRNIGYLRRHVELNQLAQVVIVEAAVVDLPRSVQMMPGASPSEASVAVAGPWTVRGVSLDAWRAETAAQPPMLVKIDVEGAEDRVLAGAADTFRHARPTIFLSLHGERQRTACNDMLRSWGYTIRSLEPGRSVEETSEWLAEC